MKKAFTIIELILTMVILSIVAYIATGLIAKTYISYNRVNSLQKANLKVEIALNSIVKRLGYSIAQTVVKRKSATDNSIYPIESAPSDYNVLEWIGYDIDGFEAHNIDSANKPKDKPAWSGFCNIDKSSKIKVVTPGSDLNFASNVIANLSNSKITNLKGSAIFFSANYNYRNIGYSNTTGGISGVAIIDSFSSNYFNLKQPIQRVTEHYKLAWSAYAIVPTNCTINGVNIPCLELRYNYRPWLNEQYNSSTTQKSILATNVTVFKTYATQNRIHIKLCVQEKIGIGANKTTSICKEKVVLK